MNRDGEQLEAALAAIRARARNTPRVGLVLGSGLGALAEELEEATAVEGASLPGWPRSTVAGHTGRLVLGMLEGQAVIVQQGRAHLYEGYTPQEITFPVQVMRRLGIGLLILTNAAGGIRHGMRVGDLMLLNDHINFPGMAGHNPLGGPNDDNVGPRFVGMSRSYDRELRRLARETAAAAGITAHEGVYACVAGPNFETPAEIRMLRALGADAVGMSTVHETLVARHAGLRVLACSGITNVCIDAVDSEQEANHEEVLEAGALLVPRLTAVLRGVLRALG